MKQKIIISLLALFIVLTMGNIIAIIYMSENINELKNLIDLHEVELLRRSLIIKIQNVQKDLYTLKTPLAPDLDSIVNEVLDLEQTAQSCTGCHHDPSREKKIRKMQSLLKEYEDQLSYYITTSANKKRIETLKSQVVSTGEKLITLTRKMSHSATLSLTSLTSAAMTKLSMVKGIIITTNIITLFLGIIIAYRLTGSILRPIRALLKATRMISSGRFGYRTDFKDSTEFGELAEHFNQMSETIQKGYEKIKQEVEERRRAEIALRQSEERFRAFFEFSPIGTLILPVNADPISVRISDVTYNSTFLKLFNYMDYELKDMHVEDLIHCDEIKEFRRLIMELLKGIREHIRRECRFIKKNGNTFWGLINMSLIKDQLGNPYQILLSIVDITERKKMQEEQLKIEKLESLGILAGGIAHDFNNILTSIMVNLARIKITPEQEKILSIVKEIEDACNHARELTEKFITFSRGGPPEKKLASLKEIVMDASNLALKGSRIKAEFSIQDDLWPSEVDSAQINQVFLNLVINARQAMPGGGIIQISAENITIGDQPDVPLRPGNYVRIGVKDHGIGILPEHLTRIFDPYFTTKQDGSGLGLSSAYSIVKGHGGYIDVESEPGKGTVFYVYLPATPISERQLSAS